MEAVNPSLTPSVGSDQGGVSSLLTIVIVVIALFFGFIFIKTKSTYK
jgi:hypothetical protein